MNFQNEKYYNLLKHAKNSNEYYQVCPDVNLVRRAMGVKEIEIEQKVEEIEEESEVEQPKKDPMEAFRRINEARRLRGENISQVGPINATKLTRNQSGEF